MNQCFKIFQDNILKLSVIITGNILIRNLLADDKHKEK